MWLLLLFSFLSLRLLQAAEEIPKLRPPRDVLLPTFWERHGGLVVLGAAVVLAVIAGLIWRGRRLKPAAIPSPSVVAQQALDRLRDRAEDLDLAADVSRIVRRYGLDVFVLQNDELTTEELIKAVRSCFASNPELLESLSSLLRECDTNRFAPVPPPAPEPLVNRALDLIAKLESHRHPPVAASAVQPGPTKAASSAA